MLITLKIKKHIAQLGDGQMFTNREFLPCAKRGTVDQVLCRMVKRGLIIRLARGVYIREGEVIPSYCKIAKFKAAIFGKEIMEHPADIAKGFGLIDSGNQDLTYTTNGCSSSFQIQGKRIYFKRSSARKTIEGKSKVRSIIRALWYLGKDEINNNAIRDGMIRLNKFDRKELKISLGLMPTWMHELFGSVQSNFLDDDYLFLRLHLPMTNSYLQGIASGLH